MLTAARGVFCPQVSPDGKRIVLGIEVSGETRLAEVAADGSGFHEIMRGVPDSELSCAEWTPDSKYLLYTIDHPVGADIWTTPVQSGILRRHSQPTQLTNGPLTYSGVAPGPDGKKTYAIGTKPRGELVRYDAKTKQFVPFLGGISATHPTFSRDGQWVVYRSYSDHTLWRSRPDGTDRLQLTYPPFDASDPEISQDGKQVVFQSDWAET